MDRTDGPGQVAAAGAFESLCNFARSLHPRSAPNPARIAELLFGLFRPTTLILYERDSNRRHFRLSATHPEELSTSGRIKERFERVSAENPAFGAAITKMAPVLIDEGHEDTAVEPLAFDQSIKHQLAIPIVTTSTLMLRDEVSLVAFLNWFEVLPWDPSLLVAVAAAAASVLSAAYNSLLIGRRHEQHIGFLLRITDLSTSDTDALYYGFLSALAALVPTKFVSLWLYDNSN